MRETPAVCVLLSTYNGQKYLLELLDSIVAQRDVDVQIIARDDGSKDSTLDILHQYNKCPITIIEGENLGSTKSFFQLIRLCGEAEYYAFADQDDVWDPDKLICAVKKLKKYNNIPAIYSSNARLVDSNLKEISIENKKPKLTIGSALIKNYATGCTVVFNNILMTLLKEYQPSDVPFHDWWANLVALACNGVSVFDNSPHISYRQHNDNVVGADSSFISKMNNRFKKYLHQEYHRNNFSSELLKAYGKYITKENKRLLSTLSEFPKGKFRLIFDTSLKTNKIFDNFLFDICILTNKI